MQLFRDEALQRQSSSTVGSVRLAHNPSYTVLAGCSAAIICALLAYVMLGGAMRKERLQGVLVPAGGSATLTSAVVGTILAQYKTEGDFVQEGDSILLIGVDRTGGDGATGQVVAALLEAKLTSVDRELVLRRKQSSERQQELLGRISRLEHERQLARESVQLAEQRVALSQVRVGRSEGLAAQGFVSPYAIEDLRFELIEARERLETSRRTAASLNRDAMSIRAQIGIETTQAEADLAAMARSRLAVSQEMAENDTRRTVLVQASKSGILSVVNSPPGASISVGQALASIIPTDQGIDGAVSPVRLEASLYARSQAVGFIEPGKKVWLRYSSYPYEKFGAAEGVVSRVTSTPIGPSELPAAQARALLRGSDTEEPLYRVDVSLSSQRLRAYGKELELKAGMQLVADVVLEERRIWEWLLHPLLAVARGTPSTTR